MRGEADLDEGAKAYSQPGAIEPRMIALDDSAFLEPDAAPRALGSRESDLLAKLGIGEAAIGLKRGKEIEVELIKRNYFS
jgi:hypothetical protein